MKKPKENNLTTWATHRFRAVSGLALVAIFLLSTTIITIKHISTSPWNAPELMPWESVGGCGASSAGGSGSSYQWLGRGLSGTMLDFEVRLSKMYQTANAWGMGIQKVTTIPITINFHPYGFFFNTMSLAMPIQWKEKDFDKQTGGIGDLSLTLQKKMGMTGQIGTSLGLTIPTGKYDVHDVSHEYVEPVMQLGSGLFGVSLSADYSIDKDWGLMTFGGSYSAGLFRIETEEYEWDEKLLRGIPSKRTLKWARVTGDRFITDAGYDYNEGRTLYDTVNVGAGAENDFGTMTPDNLSLFFYAGKKGTHTMTSAGLSISIPMAFVGFKQYSREKQIRYDISRIQLDPQMYPDADAAMEYYLAQELDQTNSSGDKEYFVSGKAPEDTTGTTWIYGESSYKKKKNWTVLSPGVGMEIQTKYIPIFMSFTLPLELNMDEGIGFNGFTFDVGMKFMAF